MRITTLAFGTVACLALAAQPDLATRAAGWGVGILANGVHGAVNGALDGVRDGAAGHDGPSDAAGSADPTVRDLARVCPMIDAYLGADAAGQRAMAQAVTVVARQVATQTGDPVLAQVAEAVPVALGTHGKARDTALLLIRRQCQSHGSPLG